MKNLLLVSFLITIIHIFSINSQIPPTPSTIEVNGTATIKVAPDIMKFSLEVQTDNKNVVYAKNENDKVVLQVLDVLKNYGILEKDMQTSGVRVSKNYSYDYTNNNDDYKKDTKLYSIYNDISFSLKDISKYYEVTTDLIKIQHLTISYSTYDYSKIIETKKEARERALLAAKNKAEEMASVLGQDLGKPMTIQEIPIEDYYPYQFNNANQQVIQSDATSGYGVLREGTMDVTAKVRIVYELINK